MKKRKNKKFLVRKIVALVLLVMILLVGKKVIYQFSSQKEKKQTRLLFNNSFVNLSSELYIEDAVIYLSEEDVKNIFDDAIYYNMGDKELITTYNKHVAVMHLNQTEMLVNDSKISIEGSLKEIDQQIYLPITDLEIVYDIEIEYASDTNVVIMDSTTKAKKQVLVLGNVKVKQSKNPFSITIEKGKKGDYLYVLEEQGRYLKVRTESR